MQRKLILIGVSILAIVLGMIAYFLFLDKPALRGSIITPPWPAPALDLTDHNGQPFTMEAQRGKVVLLYFGYVNCPSECPLTMAHIKLALENLGERAASVQVIMVSTDPLRDTPQALKDFMEHFSPTFLGLTGTSAQLAATWKAYGVGVEDGGETHSTFLYVIDPSGNVRETFLPDSAPVDIARDIKLLLAGK